MEEDGGTMKSEIRWCKTWLKHDSRFECSSCSPTRFSTVILTAGCPWVHLPNEKNFCNVSKIINCCDSSSRSSVDLQLHLINVFLCCRQTRTPHLPDLIGRLLQKTLANVRATEQPALRKCSEIAFQNTRFLEQTAWKKPTAELSVTL